MPANFLHGVETIDVDNGSRPVREVKSAVTLLAGTAPAGPVNTPTLVLSETDIAQFLPANGAPMGNHTIPRALRAIFNQRNATVIVVNVSKDGLDTAVAADIIGGVDAAGKRTGLKLAADCYNLFGYFPKMLIAPGFCQLAGVAAEQVVQANAVGAYTLIDAPVGATVAQVIGGRGPSGTIHFETSSRRAILCYPHVRAYDTWARAEALQPLSQFAAGVIGRKDNDNGYWWSPSNTEILGITGLERPLTARIDDPQSEVNVLNEAGVVTVFNSFGTGFRLWGNRSAAFPTSTALDNFIAVGRTKDMIDEAIRYNSLQFSDHPVSQGLIDSLVMTTKSFFNIKIGQGALLGGDAWFNPKRNPQAQLAHGQVLISYRSTPPPPMERLTYESELTSEYLVNLKSA